MPDQPVVLSDVQPPAPASPRYSMKGYRIGTWISKNKNSLKALVVAAGAIGTTWATELTQLWLPADPVMQGLVLTFLLLISALLWKLFVDALDYFLGIQNDGSLDP